MLLLKLAGATTAFALLFYFADFRQVLSTLSLAEPAWVAMGVTVFLAGQIVAATRWRLILQHGEVRVPLRTALRINLIGTFAGNFLPGAATGDLAKSALLFNAFPGKRAFLLTSVVYDRLLGLAAIFILLLVGTLLTGFIRNEWVLLTYAACGSLFFIAALFILASGTILPGLIRLLPQAWSARIANFMRELRSLFQTRRLIGSALQLSLVFQLSWVISQWAMLNAVTTHAPFVPVLVASTASLIISLLPITLNGLGLREGTFSYLLQHFGIEPELAVAAALLSLLPILVSSAIGGVLLGWGRHNAKSGEGNTGDGK